MAAFGSAGLVELHHANRTLEGLEHFDKLEMKEISRLSWTGQADGQRQNITIDSSSEILDSEGGADILLNSHCLSDDKRLEVRF